MIAPNAICLAALIIVVSAQTTKIVLTNDDGWAVAQIRAQNDALKAAGYDVRFAFEQEITFADSIFNQVILSAPAENESGTGSMSATPQPLTEPCQFESCPTGSPAEGFNATDRESLNRLVRYYYGFSQT
jgi:5'-nucleotidase